MKVCKPFGTTLPYEKLEYDAESNITKRVPYNQKTLAKLPGSAGLKGIQYCFSQSGYALQFSLLMFYPYSTLSGTSPIEPTLSKDRKSIMYLRGFLY